MDIINESDSDHEYEYEYFIQQWENEFPNSPFTINLDSLYLNKLDEPFVDKDYIIIKDDRTTGYYYDNFSDDLKNKFINYTIVKSTNSQKITLRHILNKLIKNKHYSNEIVVQDDHCFLEGIEKINNNMYELYFGS